MFKKISNISFWTIIYGIFGLSMYWTGKLITSSLNEPIIYSILLVPPLITLFGFELYGVSCISFIAFKNEDDC